MNTDEIKKKINKIKITKGSTTAYTEFDKSDYYKLKNLLFYYKEVSDKSFFMKEVNGLVRVYRIN